MNPFISYLNGSYKAVVVNVAVAVALTLEWLSESDYWASRVKCTKVRVSLADALKRDTNLRTGLGNPPVLHPLLGGDCQ